MKISESPGRLEISGRVRFLRGYEFGANKLCTCCSNGHVYGTVVKFPKKESLFRGLIDKTVQDYLTRFIEENKHIVEGAVIKVTFEIVDVPQILVCELDAGGCFGSDRARTKPANRGRNAERR